MTVRRNQNHADQWEVYALAAAPLPPRLRAGRVSLDVFPVGPVAAIVGPQRRAAASTEQALRQQHAIVLALAAQVDPLLPVRFGTRMTSDRLEAAIRPSASIIADALEHVRGRCQMTVRLVGPQAVESPASGKTTGTAYLTRRHREFHALPAEAVPVQAAAKALAFDERIQQGRGAFRATLFHLIGRERVEPYRAAVDAALSDLPPPWGGTVSGPWPPFAFAPELIA
jgi:hypothetical protein